MRSIKCRDLKNFLELKKLEVVSFFFNFQRIFYLLKVLTKMFYTKSFDYDFVDLVELILNIYFLLGHKVFFTIIKKLVDKIRRLLETYIYESDILNWASLSLEFEFGLCI